jgi:hypothetical protein
MWIGASSAEVEELCGMNISNQMDELRQTEI